MLSFSLCLSSVFHPERHLGTAVLLRTFQSYEPHVMYWVWHVPPSGNDRRLVDHPQHDCWCNMLRHVCRPRHSANPIPGLISTAIPGEGESRLLILPLSILLYFMWKRLRSWEAYPEKKISLVSLVTLNVIDLWTGTELTHSLL